MPITPVEKIWMNGKMVDWDQAQIHVLSHVVHYGSSWFEGIRCYDTKKGLAIFRLDKHLERLYDSVKIYHSEIPYTRQEFEQAIIQTILVNKMRACYIRPIVYRGYGDVGVNRSTIPWMLPSRSGSGEHISAPTHYRKASMCVSRRGLGQLRTLFPPLRRPAATTSIRSSSRSRP